ncbi:hypothetical protein ACE3IK_21945 [Enterobacter hormaechei subsp. xiangfangensis]|jgi:hypothetical protein|uniref:hypothetical protein n=1 Tax=Enterobacter cloacae complex TaxID=354276 RepID=UPI0006DA266D|nr:MULTISPECIES: hypothetical protein [Enterobacter cloacae complex]ELY2058864.1 hypothetical protein [Enterobacter hormaechei]ELY2068107.1 hypothetical protein [Enterobacter hormaechei]KTJ50897.1 hypothetical protein ASU82_23695 [Enterobacter hormaechei subsp. xiangfangensis]MCC9358044.1 hypothetical protein [Enterobacter hormaechei subsp. xiangfangensis]MCK1002038.1 hypothetical protein [Enterobacter hormaechei subsp. xiangfangensis]
MKNLSIEYRDGKFIQLVIDGVVMKRITSIQFSHTVGEDVPTLTFSGHVSSEYGKGAQKFEQVDKHSG